MRKKNFIGLSIFLLVFLLGLSSTSYAALSDNYTHADFLNALYNIMTNMGSSNTTWASNVISNNEVLLNEIYYNNSPNYFIGIRENSSERGVVFVFYQINDSTHQPLYYNNKFYLQNRSGSTRTYYYIHGNTSFTSIDSDTVSNNNSVYAVGNKYISSYNFYNNSTLGSGSIVKPSGYSPSNLLDGDYTDEHFEWYNNDNLETIYIDSFGDAPIKLLNFTHGNCYIGYVQQREYLAGVSLVRYIYSNISNSWVILDQNNADILLSKEVDGDKYKLYVNTNVNNLHGSIYMVSLISNSSNFENIRAYFYIKTKNDSFNNSGGLISPIFSGDPDYEDQNKHADTIDKIKDVNDTLTDDSQVDNILADNFSGDNLIGNLGYSPLENPFTTIIINTVSSFTDALLDSGNETLSFTLYNSTITLHSEDFTIPAGTLKSFLSLLFNGFLVYEIIKYGFQLYQWINSGRLQNLVNETNNHQYYLF